MKKSLTSLPLLKVVLPGEAPAEEDGRVVELFRNRAELKKAYSGLQQEIHRLRDRLKQQEGATARVQELLEGLEQRLATSETAYPALVFYQLRGLWQSGRRLLERRAADLARQHEERERRLHLLESNRRQFARRQQAENRRRAAETQAVTARQTVADLSSRHGRLTRFWQYFERRRAEHALVAARAAAAGADEALREAREACEALANEALGEWPGLSIEARRAVNIAMIAYAEALCLRLAKTRLVGLAKEAAARREATDEYGSREECERLMAEIARARIALEQNGQPDQELRERSERLRAVARYRNPEDTVPLSESLGFGEGDALAHGPVGVGVARLPNVLAEDTWDIFRVVLR